MNTSDGSGRPQVPLTVIEPAGNARGGIVVLHESREFGDGVIDLLNALAAEGWLVAAPNLFHREQGPEGPNVSAQTLFADFDEAFGYLTARDVFADTVGVLGFDRAGTAALLVATNRSIGAAVSVSALGIVEGGSDGTPALVDAAGSLRAPWLGLYGEDDPATPAHHVEQLREAAGRADVATNVVSYRGLSHRADEGTASDRAEATEASIVDAKQRIFDWFDSNLR